MTEPRLSLFKKILFSAFTFVFCISATEAGLRIAQGPLPPSVNIYSFAGSPDRWFQEVGPMVRPSYKHQAESFPRESSRPRLAFLGGSTVHGGTPTVGLHQEFPALVGAALQQKAWNLARPAIDSHDIRKIVEELKDYSFDAWVIYTGHNDFGNTYFFQRYGNWTARTQLGVAAFLSRFRLYHTLRSVQRPMANGVEKGISMSNFNEKGVSMEQKEAALSLLLDNVARISWLADSEGIPLLFVIPADSWIRRPLGKCTRSLCLEREHRTALDRLRRAPEESVKQLADICDRDTVPLRIPSFAQDALESKLQELGVEYIHAHKELPRDQRGDFPKEELFFDHVHLSKEGHQALARLIAPKLQQLLKESR